MPTPSSQIPDYLFEVSWEVCNKVGGIHTVVSTKSVCLGAEFGNRHLLIGPDIWKETDRNPEFIEDKMLFRSWKESLADKPFKIRTGRWNIPSKPLVILIDFTPLYSKKDEVFTKLYEKYGLDSLSGQWDYIEPALFGYAAGMAIESFYYFHLSYLDKTVARFHE